MSERKCNHRRCDGGPCKSLTAAQLTPTDADERRARALLALGYKQTSGKYRALRAGDAYLEVSVRVFRAMKRLGLGLWCLHDAEPYPSFWDRREEAARKPFVLRLGECGHYTRFS